ncbi:MAG: DNA translocase FtsK [Candidatus Auribacterota bacterium]
MASKTVRNNNETENSISHILNKFKEVWAALILLFSIYLLLSYLTYNEADLSTFTGSAHDGVIHNFFGITGAYTAYLNLICFGFAAYVPPFYFFIWAIRSFFCGFTITWTRIYTKTLLFIAILLSATIFVQMANTYIPLSLQSILPVTESGGIVGSFIATKFAGIYLGFYGSIVISAFVFIAASLLITDGWPLVVFKWILYKLLQLFIVFYNSIVTIVTYCRDDLSKKSSSTPVKIPEKKKTKPVFLPDDDDDDLDNEPEPKAQKISQPFEAKITTNTPSTVELPPPPQTQKHGSGQIFELPPVTLLEKPKQPKESDVTASLKNKAELLQNTLAEFGIEVNVSEITRGPVITRYELTLAPGIKVQKITGLTDDIALAMKTPNIRIIAPIPGKSAVGIEVPNDLKAIVSLRDLLCSQEFINTKAALPLALGKDVSGASIITDMTAAPHLLIAGATGSGKSVCLNSIIMSLVYSCSPDKLKFIMVDPKKVELVQYNDLPHMITPVITNPKKAAPALLWLVTEMEKRYQILADAGVRNIKGFNALPEDKRIAAAGGDQQIIVSGMMSYILVILDELADLMMVAQDEIEDAITRLAQLSRAVGIHLILATQRPSVNVITGVIKANFPVRISFKVSSKVDSRTVLDANGAEALLGNGDFLFLPPGTSKLIRGQGTYVSDAEIHRVVKFVNDQVKEDDVEFIDIFSQDTPNGEPLDDFEDELYDQAVEMVKLTQQASASMLQRKLRVGYARAARLIDIMEANGVVGPHRGSKPREIIEE